MQLPFFQQVIDWISTQPELKEAMDLEHIGVSGHSRGAKLAALHFASGEPPGQGFAPCTTTRLRTLLCSTLRVAAHLYNEN